MPSTIEAINVFLDAKILFGPGKAANAGGVSTSGLEMSQNSMRLSWTREEVDQRLHTIMQNIHQQCIQHGTDSDGFTNYVKGANIAGYIKVANAMISQGIMFPNFEIWFLWTCIHRIYVLSQLKNPEHETYKTVSFYFHPFIPFLVWMYRKETCNPYSQIRCLCQRSRY